MRLLMIGGTLFLGRHIVEAALAAGHEVTMFNRGRTNDDLFPSVERIRGDRNHDLDRLVGRRWDVVIDTCGYLPAQLHAAAMALREAVSLYIFISSISVYDWPIPFGADETAALATMDEALADRFDVEHYGALKARCERALTALMGERALNVRAGLLIGPYDPTGRLGYWIDRVADGGEMLVPGRLDRTLQLIDTRDVAGWLLRMGSEQRGGTFNVTGPVRPLTMDRLLSDIAAVTGSDPQRCVVDEAFLLANEVQPFNELPLWLPADQAGMLNVDIGRAVAAGLSFRPLRDSVADIAAWQRENQAKATLASGITMGSTLSRQREATLLAAYRDR